MVIFHSFLYVYQRVPETESRDGTSETVVDHRISGPMAGMDGNR